MTALFMHSASRWNTRALCAVLMTGAAFGIDLPAGPGKAETEKICGTCHEIERSIAPRQDKAGWQATIDKMVSMGATGTPKELEAVRDYLAAHYPAPEVDRLNVNTARQIELESAFGIPRSQAAAIIAYREKNGPFKDLAALKKVPGVDVAKIEAKKDRLAF